jgi:hypothetical protein
LAEGNNFLDRVITVDETWCFQYDPETKRQSMQWKTSASPRPKKARQGSPSEDNAHLFFDHKGIVHFEFLEEGRTVNQNCYLQMLAGYVWLFVGEDLNFGLMLGSCIMTMPLLMTRLLSGSLWPKNR